MQIADIEMAGHLGVGRDPTLNNISWALGKGSSNISGGPYHFKLDELDGNALGSQDNQIKSSAILPQPGQIIVQKETDPDGSDQVFEFVPSWSSNFYLSDGESNSSGELEPGTYSVTESPEPGWTLSSAVCSDGSDPSSIGLDEGETVRAHLSC